MVSDWGPFALVVVVNTMITLSTRVMRWWRHESSPSTTPLPSAAGPMLRAREGASDADVHVLLWFVAAFALAWALRRTSARTIVCAGLALWAYTGVLEFCQRWVPARTSSWADLVGNGIGVAIGLSVGTVAFHLLDRRAARRVQVV
jgi:VanZ family protein